VQREKLRAQSDGGGLQLRLRGLVEQQGGIESGDLKETQKNLRAFNDKEQNATKAQGTKL
jgi:hypothetical protein